MRRSLGASAVLVLALSIIPAAPASAAGVTDWQYNATTRHTYGLTGEMTWVDAEALAVRFGGHLVTINDQAEQDWLLARFPDPYAWIGMNDRAREGTWVWSSRTRVTFTAWQDTQPDDWKGFDPLGEDAAVLSFPGDQPPGWVSISGRWLGRGIVEVPGKPKSFAANTPVERRPRRNHVRGGLRRRLLCRRLGIRPGQPEAGRHRSHPGDANGHDTRSPSRSGAARRATSGRTCSRPASATGPRHSAWTCAR